jgi:hypothetical protein
MGYYLNHPEISNWEKAAQLRSKFGAEVVDKPDLSTLTEDKALICVVENGFFDAVLLCYNQRELDDALHPGDARPKVFMIMDKAVAHEMADFKP